MRYLPGQMTMFPEIERRHADMAHEPCRPSADPRAAAAERLPNTCTPEQAHRATGVSVRQLKYWVEDGTLLAVNSARCPVCGPKRRGKLDRWRIVVRRVPGLFDTAEMLAYPTLEELVARASNARAAR